MFLIPHGGGCGSQNLNLNWRKQALRSKCVVRASWDPTERSREVLLLDVLSHRMRVIVIAN